MNLFKWVFYPWIFLGTIGRSYSQEGTNPELYDPKCNLINYNAGLNYNKLGYLNYKNQNDFDSCIPEGQQAKVGCGKVYQVMKGLLGDFSENCDLKQAPNRALSFNDAGNHMIEKGKEGGFKTKQEVMEDPYLKKTKDNSFFVIPKSDRKVNRNGVSKFT